MKLILIFLGFLSTGLAFLGVFLPLLPTTPFLLIAAACFARSSRRFHHWLHHNRFLGEYIRNYRFHRGVTRRHKTITLLILWLSILASLSALKPSVWIWIVLPAIGAAVSFHVLSLKTLNKIKPPAGEPEKEVAFSNPPPDNR